MHTRTHRMTSSDWSCDVINMRFAIDEITDSQSGAEARDTIDHHLRILFGEPCDGSPLSKMTAAYVSIGVARIFVRAYHSA